MNDVQQLHATAIAFFAIKLEDAKESEGGKKCGDSVSVEEY